MSMAATSPPVVCHRAAAFINLVVLDAVCVSMPCGLVLYHRAVLMHAAMAGLA